MNDKNKGNKKAKDDTAYEQQWRKYTLLATDCCQHFDSAFTAAKVLHVVN